MKLKSNCSIFFKAISLTSQVTTALYLFWVCLEDQSFRLAITLQTLYKIHLNSSYANNYPGPNAGCKSNSKFIFYCFLFLIQIKLINIINTSIRPFIQDLNFRQGIYIKVQLCSLDESRQWNFMIGHSAQARFLTKNQLQSNEITRF